eukprot:745617-Hanusia_phi.AAC.2
MRRQTNKKIFPGAGHEERQLGRESREDPFDSRRFQEDFADQPTREPAQRVLQSERLLLPPML